MNARTKFTPVSKVRPCAVCRGDHKCSVGEDGLIVCGRAGGDVDGFTHLGESDNDPQWNLYRASNPMVAALATRTARAPARPAPDWPREAERYARNLTDAGRAELAARLGLPARALAALPLIGADAAGAFWTFPECDAAGRVVGINRRFRDGTKKVIQGGARGLTTPAGWHEGPGPVLLVEGASDVLALTAAGLSAVGRPSNTGGVEHLVALLADIPRDREVIVVGENDQNPSGLWPGRDGAVRTATALAAKLARPVAWALTPDGAKDPRAWLSDRREFFPDAAFLSALDKTVVAPAAPPADVPVPVPERDDDPHRLARLFAAGHRTPAGECTLARWQSQFYRWDAGAYARLPDELVRADLTAFVREQFERDYAATEGNDKRPAAVRPVRQSLVSDVLGALHGMVAVPFGVNPPDWLDGTTTSAADTISTPNGIVNLSALADGRAGAVTPPTPRFFTTTKTGTGYDPKAPAPVEWVKFLNTLWPNDPDSVACLQQWFGYLLTADTQQQKMLLLVGPTRSGKGTIAGVLRALLGEGTVAGPTLNSLAQNFGLSPLLDRSVAIVDDARLSSRTDAATVAERLLTVTGEGLIDVDRKHLPAVAGAKLGTRFVVISNELPKLGDASGALVGRMIVLRFTRSFFGREDHGLKARLLKELPGILLWAIEGWKQLRDRGRFVQPARGQELVDELHDLSSPVGAFVREQCRTGPGLTVPAAELFAEWKRWCETAGKREAGTEQSFGRDLRAVVPDLEKTRPRVAGARVWVYAGIEFGSGECVDRADDDGAGGDGPGVGTRPATAPEPARSNQRSIRGPIGGPIENAGNSRAVHTVHTTSDLFACGREKGAREERNRERNKDSIGPCGPCGPGTPNPVALLTRLLAAEPLTEPELLARFAAAGHAADDIEPALKKLGATITQGADGEWRYGLPGGSP